MFKSFYSNNILFSETKSTNKSPNYTKWSKSIYSSAEILQDESSNARNLTKECWLGQTLSCSALLLIIELIGNRCLIPSLWCTQMEATQMFSVNWMHEILIKSVIYRYRYYCFHFFNIRSKNLMNQVELFQWSSKLQQVFVYCVCQRKCVCSLFPFQHDVSYFY